MSLAGIVSIVILPNSDRVHVCLKSAYERGSQRMLTAYRNIALRYHIMDILVNIAIFIIYILTTIGCQNFFINE